MFYSLSFRWFLCYRDPNTSPGQPSSREWPVFTSEGQHYLELNSRFNNEPDKSLAVGRHLRSRECAFWEDYLPNLVTASRKSGLGLRAGSGLGFIAGYGWGQPVCLLITTTQRTQNICITFMQRCINVIQMFGVCWE